MPVFIAIGAAIAAAHHYANHLGKGEEDAPPIDVSLLHGLTPMDLLPSEERFVGEQPIQTITFYEGNPFDFAAILWERLSAVFAHNPWLGGCLVKGGKELDGNNDNAPIRIWYNESATAMHPGMFQTFPRGLIHLNRDTLYADLEAVLGEFDVSVKSNRDILNNTQEALFKVSIIPEYHPSSAHTSDGFSMVVSMSNVLGDAYTFFRLYNMLIGSAIEPLNAKRVNEFDEDMNELMGTNEAEYVAHITSDPSWEKFFINDETKSAGDLEGRLFEVSTDWVNEIKKSKLQYERKAATHHVFYDSFESPFDDLIIKDSNYAIVKRVSTNDIIVAWFWNLARPAVGLLEVNLRQSIESVNCNDAGNYSNSIAYTPDDYKTSERINRSFGKCCRVGKSFDPPTILPRVRVNTRFSLVSNHLPYYRSDTDNQILNNEGFTLVSQMPLYFASSLKGVLPKRMSFLHLFQVSQDRIGCFVVGPADVISKIDTCGIVEKKMFNF